MTRLRGWAPKGERLVDKVPQGKWKTATFLAALRNDRIDAPCLFDGPHQRRAFPRLCRSIPRANSEAGDVVILDNLGSHKESGAQGDPKCRSPPGPAKLPDLNPIEQSSQSSRPCSERSREVTKPSAKPARNPRPIPPNRRIPQNAIRVDPKADALTAQRRDLTVCRFRLRGRRFSGNVVAVLTSRAALLPRAAQGGRDVAATFGKNHRDVVAAIRDLIEKVGEIDLRNFTQINFTDAGRN